MPFADMNPITPLELLNFYYSDGQSLGNKESKLWRKFNELLTWDNILNKGYQSDLCPISFFDCSFYVFDLYNPERWKHNVRLFVYIVAAVSVASGIVAFFSYLLIPDIIIGRTILFLHINLSIILIFLWRKIFERVFLKESSRQDKILVIGNSPIVNDIKSVIQKGNDITPDRLTVIR